MTPRATQDVEMMVDRLENVYGFECPGGPLKHCVEWIALKAELSSLRSQLATLEQEKERLKEKVRLLNGWRGDVTGNTIAAGDFQGGLRYDEVPEAIKQLGVTIRSLRSQLHRSQP